MISTQNNQHDSSYHSLVSNVGPFNEFIDEYDPNEAFNTLSNAKVLVIGAGGLGCEILKDLALTGFKKIDIIDADTIEVSNLNRQFLFRSGDVGRPKAEVAAEFVKRKSMGKNLSIVPHYCRIQDKPQSFYKQFDVVICGLDSVEARRWINATLVSLVDSNLNGLIPMIDGGTEGFRGQSRVILPTVTSCYECTLDMITPKTTYPVCTIANTPRLPEHCVEWASVLEWPRRFPGKKFDPDLPEHLDWMYETAHKRAMYFKINGVTRELTLGVVKNIIPAIASTNAIIAASCCNEAFKYVTSSNPILNNYMMYSGDYSIFTYTYSHARKPNCPVCGNHPKNIKVPGSWYLREFIEHIKEKHDISIGTPSLATAAKQLYFRSPPTLEEFTRENLDRKLSDLLDNNEEVIVSDPKLPISLRLVVNLE